MYVGRVNLYRQRLWTCKATGRTGLTYEEALLSERKAQANFSVLPESVQAYVLSKTQYSDVLDLAVSELR